MAARRESEQFVLALPGCPAVVLESNGCMFVFMCSMAAFAWLYLE